MLCQSRPKEFHFMGVFLISTSSWRSRSSSRGIRKNSNEQSNAENALSGRSAVVIDQRGSLLAKGNGTVNATTTTTSCSRSRSRSPRPSPSPSCGQCPPMKPGAVHWLLRCIHLTNADSGDNVPAAQHQPQPQPIADASGHHRWRYWFCRERVTGNGERQLDFLFEYLFLAAVAVAGTTCSSASPSPSSIVTIANASAKLFTSCVDLHRWGLRSRSRSRLGNS